MRITGGILGGRALAAPKDGRVRPTSDKVRQAIFNILSHGIGFELQGARVIDLFAGTGALGLEALSHGASYCLFVDDHAESRALIRGNVEALGQTGVSKIWRRDATKLGENNFPPFDLAFLDPPYRKGLIGPALASLRDGGWLTAGAVVVAEMAEDDTIAPVVDFSGLDHRAYGETRVEFLAYGR